MCYSWICESPVGLSAVAHSSGVFKLWTVSRRIESLLTFFNADSVETGLDHWHDQKVLMNKDVKGDKADDSRVV